MQTDRLLTNSVSKTFFRYLFPAILANMVTSIYILADTITPPSNPMAPVDLSAFPTFVGTLQMFQLTGIDGLCGQYFCGIRLLTPIEGPSYIYYSLFLLDYRIERLVRFDHPMLESCVVGDTIYVTGEPKAISGGVALGVTMRYVQPK